MTFALLYETGDLAVIGNAIAVADGAAISQADKLLLRRYWQNGINGWQSAPAYDGDPSCPLCRILTCTYGSAAEFIGLCHRLAGAVGGDTLYLHALADDMAHTALEPYP